MSLIYLASPYSHKDQKVSEARFNAVCHAAARLMAAGEFVFSPIAHTHPIAMEGTLPTGWEYWRRYDIVMMDACTELRVLTIPGWQESKGVRDEMAYMRIKGKPVTLMEPDAAELNICKRRKPTGAEWGG